MKQKNKKTTNTPSKPKAFAVGTRSQLILASVPYTENDFKNALLIVSIAINLFVLTAWITTQVSGDVAYTIAHSLVN